MAKILARNINAGSVGLVTSGGSTTTYSTLPTTSDPVLWLRAAEVGLQEAVTNVLIDDLSGSGSGVEGARLPVSHEVSGSIRVPMTHEGMPGLRDSWIGAQSTPMTMSPRPTREADS